VYFINLGKEDVLKSGHFRWTLQVDTSLFQKIPKKLEGFGSSKKK